MHRSVTVQIKQWADIRVPALLDTPAAVRWLSCEPLIGPVDLRCCGGVDAIEHDWAGGPGGGTGGPHPLIGWVVVGGESGPGARPMQLDWARSLVEQCRAAAVPVFVKQLGSRWADRTSSLLPVEAKRDPKGGSPEYWPDDLQVREYPRLVEGVARD